MIEGIPGQPRNPQIVELHLDRSHLVIESLDLTRMVAAYRDFVDILPSEEASIRVGIVGVGIFTRAELAEHAVLGDPVGIEWAQTILEGEYAGLKGTDKQVAISKPEILVQRVETRFREAIARRTHRRQPT